MILSVALSKESSWNASPSHRRKQDRNLQPPQNDHKVRHSRSSKGSVCLYGSAQEQNLCWRAENNAEPVKPNLSKPKNKTEYDPSVLYILYILCCWREKKLLMLATHFLFFPSFSGTRAVFLCKSFKILIYSLHSPSSCVSRGGTLWCCLLEETAD